jgi:hypothetical protein
VFRSKFIKDDLDDGFYYNIANYRTDMTPPLPMVAGINERNNVERITLAEG